jgi:exodeoxyribonuclease-3
MRIDLVLASEPVAAGVQAAWIDREARKGKGPSDHAPVRLGTEPESAPKALSGSVAQP